MRLESDEAIVRQRPPVDELVNVGPMIRMRIIVTSFFPSRQALKFLFKLDGDVSFGRELKQCLLWRTPEQQQAAASSRLAIGEVRRCYAL